MRAVTARQTPEKHLRSLLFILILCVVVGVLAALPAAAKEVHGTYGSFSVEANIHTKQHNQIIVTAELSETFLENLGGQTLYLFGLRAGEYGDVLSEHKPLATAKAEKKTTFTVEDDGTGERYYLAYVIALGVGEEFKALHTPVTVENPEILSPQKKAERKGGSIKGIVSSGAYVGEVTELGVSHAVIPIVLDKYLSLNKSDAAYSVSFGGVMTNFDKTKIGQLDAHVAALRAAGVNVTFRFLLDGSTRTTNAQSSWLYASGANENGTLYAITAEDKDSFLLLRGIFTYFADRYAADGILDFIIGYEVNEADVWNRMGDTAEADYAREYAKVFKIAQTALLSVNQNCRVYVPISNLWVSARPFLEAFSKEMDGAAWHVAIAPYASISTDDSVWSDSLATDSATTTYITAHNLTVLKDFLENDEYLLDGKRRRVIIDDFAVHADPNNDAALERQAASLAYAYYNAVNADFIDAFIYHRIADNEAESISLGLCQENGVQKPAYRIYRSIDTSMGEKETKYLATVIGEKRWQSIIDGFSPRDAVAIERFEETGENAEDVLSSYERTPFLDFLDGSLGGFLPYANVSTAKPLKQNTQGTDLPETVLTFTTVEMPFGEAAYIARSLSDVDMNGVDGLAITVTVNGGGLISAQTADTDATSQTPAANSTAATVILRIMGERKGKTTVYEARANVAVGDRTTVVFPIEDFVNATRAAKTVWIGVTSAIEASGGATRERQAPYTVTVDSIDFLESKSGWIAVAFGWLLGILLILVLIFGLLVLRKHIRMKKRRKAMEARRRAQLARMQAQRGRAEQIPTNIGQSPVQRPTPQSGAGQMPRRSASRTPQMRTPTQDKNVYPRDLNNTKKPQ